MKDKDILLSAARELARYINLTNEKIHRDRDLLSNEEPPYHDSQTCHELVRIANSMDEHK